MLLALWAHIDSIPNSIVKRDSGEDTNWVAGWDNSSMPGFFLSPPVRGFFIPFFVKGDYVCVMWEIDLRFTEILNLVNF